MNNIMATVSATVTSVEAVSADVRKGVCTGSVVKDSFVLNLSGAFSLHFFETTFVQLIQAMILNSVNLSRVKTKIE